MAIIFTERSEQIDRAGYEAWHEYQRTHNGDTPDHSESFQMGAEWADNNPQKHNHPVLAINATNAAVCTLPMRLMSL